jgi:type I restriction enzyme S subunit
VSTVLTAQEPSAKYLVNLQPPLVRHFDLIAQAPGGVARLRELILTLAVQGKLVPQDPSDEPASELLKKIRAEKDRLIAEGKIKRDKQMAEIGDDEKPFQLPVGWSWEPLGSLGNIFSGNSINAAEKEARFAGVAGLPFIATKDVGYGLERLGYENGIRIPLSEHSFKVAHAGAVLMCAEGGSAGKKCGLVDQDICFGNKLFANEPYAGISSKFILFVYLAPYFFESFKSSMTGIIGGISLAKFLELPIPLPPLAEQSRIVRRVEELMQLCDALEASGQIEAQQHAQLVNTLLDTLIQSETPGALADNWQRIATHFDVLLDRPEAVDALEQTILQLAVRGLLVPQDPTDEPASVLLQKIRTEKDHLIAQGKIKRDKPLQLITDEEKPFELPRGWEWVALAEVALKGPTNGLSPKPQELPTNIRCLSLSATTQGVFKSECFKYVDVELKVAEQFFLKTGDLLIQRGNSIDYVGIAAVYDGPDDAFIYPDLMMRLQLGKLVNTQFVHMALICNEGRSYFRNNATGTQGTMPKVNQAIVAGAPIPLPPLDEQSRIVTRVNELRSLCVDLREKFVNSRVAMENLSKALVFEA